LILIRNTIITGAKVLFSITICADPREIFASSRQAIHKMFCGVGEKAGTKKYHKRGIAAGFKTIHLCRAISITNQKRLSSPPCLKVVGEDA
jgi:hypothetical protein